MDRKPEQTFLSRRHINGQQIYEKMHNFTVREMPIKTPVRHHLTPVRVVVNKRSNNKYWRTCGEKGTLIHCW